VIVVVVITAAAVTSDLHQELAKGLVANAVAVTVSACDRDESIFTPSMDQYQCDFNQHKTVLHDFVLLRLWFE
jgi:hypothetical protein